VIDTLQKLDLIIANPDAKDPRIRKRIIPISRSDLAEDIEKAEKALVDFRKEWEEAIEELVLIYK